MSNDRVPRDMLGVELKVGQKAARPVKCGSTPEIEIVTIDRIEGGRVFVNGSNQSLWYPSRLLVLTIKEDVAKFVGDLDCVHRCGVGHEIVQKVLSFDSVSPTHLKQERS